MENQYIDTRIGFGTSTVLVAVVETVYWYTYRIQYLDMFDSYHDDMNMQVLNLVP